MSFNLRRQTVVAESQAGLARQTLRFVTAYVRDCHEYDAEPLLPRLEQTLCALDEVSRSAFDPTTFDPALRRAARLMRQHDLWLGLADRPRVAILDSLGSLGYPVRDRHIAEDLAIRRSRPDPEL